MKTLATKFWAKVTAESQKENIMTIAIAVIFAFIYVASLLKVAAKPTPKPTPRTATPREVKYDA